MRIRATDQTALFVEQNFSLRVVEILAPVVINEIHYNPDFNPVRESFIELYNNSDQSIDLSKTVSAEFVGGGMKNLQVTFDRHNTAMRLSWQ